MMSAEIDEALRVSYVRTRVKAIVNPPDAMYGALHKALARQTERPEQSSIHRRPRCDGVYPS